MHSYVCTLTGVPWTSTNTENAVKCSLLHSTWLPLCLTYVKPSEDHVEFLYFKITN